MGQIDVPDVEKVLIQPLKREPYSMHDSTEGIPTKPPLSKRQVAKLSNNF